MKITKYIIGLSMMAGTVLGLPSCTDLSETLFSVPLSTCIAVSGYAMRTRNFRQIS